MEEHENIIVFVKHVSTTPEGTIEKFLLAFKKRGENAGKWNGVFGPIVQQTSRTEGALEILRNECNIAPFKLAPLGYLVICNEENESTTRLHAFESILFAPDASAESFLPPETANFKFQWFDRESFPLDMMPLEFPHWSQYLFSGTRFIARFGFENEDKLTDINVRPTPPIGYL
jgi:hypothetical protein